MADKRYMADTYILCYFCLHYLKKIKVLNDTSAFRHHSIIIYSLKNLYKYSDLINITFIKTSNRLTLPSSNVHWELRMHN